MSLDIVTFLGARLYQRAIHEAGLKAPELQNVFIIAVFMHQQHIATVERLRANRYNLESLKDSHPSLYECLTQDRSNDDHGWEREHRSHLLGLFKMNGITAATAAEIVDGYIIKPTET